MFNAHIVEFYHEMRNQVTRRIDYFHAWGRMTEEYSACKEKRVWLRLYVRESISLPPCAG